MAAMPCNWSSNRSLVIFPGSLGDLVCLGPALRALTRRGGGMEPGGARDGTGDGRLDGTLELMARAELARFAAGRMGIARAHSIDRRETAALFAANAGIAAAADFFGAFGRIYSFFAAEDPRVRENLLSAAAPAIVSFHRFRPTGEGHIARNYLAEVGADGAPLDGRIDVLLEDIEEARSALARLGLEGSRTVLVFPGSGGTHKNWPVEKFVVLSAMLAPPLRPLIIFGPAEHAMERVVAPELESRQIPWLSTPPLGTLAGLSRLAAAFIGNDSGVSHLAAAAGAPGVVIFGPTDPDRWRPLGQVRVVRAANLGNLLVPEVTSALRDQTKRPGS